jgi:PKD repeat protein
MRIGLTILLALAIQNIANAQFVAKSIINMGGGDIPEQVEVADLDGDGKLDVLTKPMFGNPIQWLKNNGNGTFSDSGKTLTGGFATLVSLEAFDCDNDGDQDVVGAYLHDYDSRVVLWKNTGEGNFSTGIVLTTSLSEIADVVPADIDHDGDIDIALATPYERIKWFENKLETNSWQLQDFSYDITAQRLEMVDFDKNNTLDILSISNSVRLNGVEVISGIYVATGRFIRAVDIDRDGDNDIVAAQLGYSDGLFWLENNNNQFVKHVFEGTVGRTYNDLTVFDYDNDGDEDVFADCWFDCGLTLWENTGAGSFALKTGIGGNGIQKNELKHGDLDNDGKIDIIRNDGGSHAVLWYKNNVTAFTGLTSDFVYTGTCERSDISFIHTARGKDIVSWEWDLGDGSPKTTTPRVSHSFASAGDYTVKLTVKNSSGQSNTVSKTVTIRPRPVKDPDQVFNFCKDDNTDNIVVTLPDGFNYVWSYLPDGSYPFNTTKTFTFDFSADVFVLRTNSFGCAGESLKKITVKQWSYPVSPETKGAVSYSGGSELTLQATAKPGEVVQWVTLNSDDPYHTGNTFTEKVTETTTRYVRVVNEVGCASMRTPVTASIYDKPLPAAPEFVWADPTQSDVATEGTGITKDNNGNYFATGNWGHGNFISGAYTLPAITDVANQYLLRFNKDDVTLQANNILQSEYAHDGKLVVDSDFNIYIGVNTQNAITIGGTVVTPAEMNRSYTVVAKLNSNGQYVWHKIIEGYVPHLALSGNSLIATSPNNYSTTTFAFSKVDGTAAWSIATPIGVWDMVTDHDGDVFLTGCTPGAVNNAIIQKISSTGEYLWQKDIGTVNSYSGGKGIVVDSEGNLIITGTYSSAPNLGADNNISILGTFVGGGHGYFVTKIDADGEPIWVRSFKGNGEIRDLTIDHNNDVLITGYNNIHVDGSENNLYFGGIAFSPSGLAFIARYNSLGDFQWVKNTGQAQALSAVPDEEGGAIMYGTFTGNIQLDNLNVVPRTNPPPPSKSYNAIAARLGYKLKADFKFVSACPNSETKFEDWSTAESGTTLTEWHWEFGDGGTSDLQHPRHTYTNGGQYTVKLTLKDNLARTITKSGTVNVTVAQTPPQVELLSPTVACEGTSYDYTAIVTNAGPNYNLNWYVDGVLKPGASGENTFKMIADHDREVKVRVEDPGKQCASSNTAEDSMTVPTFAVPAKPSISALVTELCAGSSTTISTTSTAPVLVWSTGESTSQITVANKGSYSLRVGNNPGCLSVQAEPIEIKVHNIPAAPVLSPAASTICEGASVEIKPVNTYAVYKWSNGANSNSIQVTSQGNYSLQVGETLNCLSQSSAPASVTVSPKPLAKITVAGNSLTSSAGTSYKWYKDNELIPFTGQQFSAEASGVYKVEVFSGAGCSNISDGVNVTISTVTGLEDETDSNLVVSPNPVRDRLYIETTARINSVKLVDILGRTVLQGESKTLDVSPIGSGAYLLFIETEFGPVTRRIIKL